MSHKQPDDLERRDIALARVLAEALKQRQTTPAAETKPAEACPEAELLAAYAERALGEQETARWENHFAACSRCQRTGLGQRPSDGRAPRERRL
jgi:hypothetical protein